MSNSPDGLGKEKANAVEEEEEDEEYGEGAVKY